MGNLPWYIDKETGAIKDSTGKTVVDCRHGDVSRANAFIITAAVNACKDCISKPKVDRALKGAIIDGEGNRTEFQHEREAEVTH